MLTTTLLNIERLAQVKSKRSGGYLYQNPAWSLSLVLYGKITFGPQVQILGLAARFNIPGIAVSICQISSRFVMNS